MTKIKKLGIAITTLAFISLCVYFIHRERFQITSHIWQIRHRGLMVFAGYSIAVPTNWYVQEEGADSALLLRLDYSPLPTDPSIHPRATISFMTEPPIADVAKWASLASASFKKTEAAPAKRSMTTADGERFSCVGGNMPAPPVTNFPLIMAWNCRSTGNLQIMLTGTEADVNQSWDILSRIRKGDPRIK